MSNPVMGDKTPRTKKAMEEAGRLPTGDHSYGYMIAFAQSLELELAALRPEGLATELNKWRDAWCESLPEGSVIELDELIMKCEQTP